MLEDVAGIDSWYFAFRICSLRKKGVMEQMKRQSATHFCVVFETVFGMLYWQTSNTKFLWFYCVDCTLIQEILINHVRTHWFAFVEPKNASRKQHAIVETHCFSVSLLTRGTRRDIFTQSVPSLRLSLLRCNFLLPVFVCSLAHLPLYFIIASLWQVYESWDSFKVNDVLEVYGILSVDPVLSILNNEER